MRGFLSFLLVACAISVQAGLRTAEQALTEASTFFSATQQQRQLAPSASPLVLTYTHMLPDNVSPALYIVQRGEDAGFVVISADDRVRTVLGYADQGYVDVQNMPENMRMWFMHYAEQIALAQQFGTRKVAVAQVDNSPVAPLLGNIQWNQDEPYNLMCPIDSDGKRCVTGCLATAVAQVMRFWNYPEQGSGSYSYSWRNSAGERTTLSADFGATTYDWEHMLPRYRSGNYSQQESDAVATLMYHVGVAAHMGYSSSGSGASGYMVAPLLQNYFRYDAAMQKWQPDYLGDVLFLQLMLEEMHTGRPALICGYTENWEGHAFVCDGYDGAGCFHINWGWGGYQDGFFALSALDPDEQGIGGAASGKGYHVGVEAYAGIRPDEGGMTIPQLGASTLKLLSDTTLLRTKTIKFNVSEVVNIGLANWSGKLGIGLWQDDQFVQWLDGFDSELYVGYWYQSLDFTGNLPSSLPDGEYSFAFTFSLPDGGYAIAPIAEGRDTYPFVLSDGQVEFLIRPLPIQEEDFTSLTFTELAPSVFGVQLAGYDMDIEFAIRTLNEHGVIGTYEYNQYIKETAGTIAQGAPVLHMQGEHKMYNAIFTILIEAAWDPFLQSDYQYVVYYSFDLDDDNHYSGRAAISMDQVSLPQDVTNQVLTSRSVAEALTALNALPDNARTDVPYLVRGIVSSLSGTAVERAETGVADFTLGATAGSLKKCKVSHCAWLNDTPFVTGDELHKSDAVIVCAYLCKGESVSTSLTDGYIYSSNGEGPILDVESVLTDDSATGIYDLLGRCVSRDESVSAGIYILQMPGSKNKVVIR